jgi:hypothetical protein
VAFVILVTASTAPNVVELPLGPLVILAIVEAARRQAGSVKPSGDAAHDHRASAAERRTVGAGNVSVSR